MDGVCQGFRLQGTAETDLVRTARHTLLLVLMCYTRYGPSTWGISNACAIPTFSTLTGVLAQVSSDPNHLLSRCVHYWWARYELHASNRIEPNATNVSFFGGDT